jgi:hypothetical protein
MFLFSAEVVSGGASARRPPSANIERSGTAIGIPCSSRRIVRTSAREFFHTCDSDGVTSRGAVPGTCDSARRSPARVRVLDACGAQHEPRSESLVSPTRAQLALLLEDETGTLVERKISFPLRADDCGCPIVGRETLELAERHGNERAAEVPGAARSAPASGPRPPARCAERRGVARACWFPRYAGRGSRPKSCRVGGASADCARRMRVDLAPASSRAGASTRTQDCRQRSSRAPPPCCPRRPR